MIWKQDLRNKAKICENCGARKFVITCGLQLSAFNVVVFFPDPAPRLQLCKVTCQPCAFIASGMDAGLAKQECSGGSLEYFNRDDVSSLSGGHVENV